MRACMHVLWQSARAGGLLVIALGVGLLTFCVVVLAHDVLPVVTVPGTLPFYALRTLLVVVSFEVLFHYICATAFCARLAPCTDDDDGHDTDNNSSSSRRSPRSRHRCARALAWQSMLRLVRRRLPWRASTHVRDVHDTTTAATTTSVVVIGSNDEAQCTSSSSSSLLRELERLARLGEALDTATRQRVMLDAPRRYCARCRRLKAPREHHCRVCDACVAKMDHHCPWLGNCVSVANERHFVLFVLWLWAGAGAATLVLGVGYVRQGNADAGVAHARGHAAATPLSSSLSSLHVAVDDFTTAAASVTSPYGKHGSRLTALPAFVTLVSAALIFACMSFFALETLQHVWSNCTPIESLVLYDRARMAARVATTTTTTTTTTWWQSLQQHRQRQSRHCAMPQRSPYDRGAWRNVLDVLGARDDPVVHYAIARLRGGGGSSNNNKINNNNNNKINNNNTTRSCASQRALSLLSRPRWSWREALVLAWLVVLPSLRPGRCDGVHYATYDDEVRAVARALTTTTHTCERDDNDDTRDDGIDDDKSNADATSSSSVAVTVPAAFVHKDADDDDDEAAYAHV